MTTRTTTSINKKAALVLVAAGSSSRMAGLGKKEYLPLNGGSVLSEAVLVFLKTGLFSTVAVAYPKNDLAAAKNAFYKNPQIAGLCKNVGVIFVPGGQSRQESVRKALAAIDRSYKAAAALTTPRAVLIHDGARPFLTAALVKKTLAAALKYGAAVPALEPVETQKEIDKSSRIARHLKRSSLAAVQTPQGFLFPEILDFHKKAAKQKGSQAQDRAATKIAGSSPAMTINAQEAAAFTDDTEIWDQYSDKKTRVIKGEPGNIKITYPKDLNGVQDKKAPACNIRVGMGTDLHRLVAGRKLILGGVVIPFDKGEDGHSDGDALLHAVTDALLGAACLGDIGSYFPPSDPKWKGADSAKLLKKAWRDVQKAGWRLQNLDCVVHLQEPKFLPHRERVRESIAKILGANKEQVFVKAKTGERVGPVGLGEVVETKAVCLLLR